MIGTSIVSKYCEQNIACILEIQGLINIGFFLLIGLLIYFIYKEFRKRLIFIEGELKQK